MSDTRKCTCHPDDIGPPCEQKYALTECRIARLTRDRDAARDALRELVKWTEQSTDNRICPVSLLRALNRARAILEAKP